MGDYFDEDEITNPNDFDLPIPAHKLVSPADYIPLLEAKPQKFTPGDRFCYCNSAYIALALIIQQSTNTDYCDFIQQHVFNPAGMNQTGFFRTDKLPSNTATATSTKPPIHPPTSSASPSEAAETAVPIPPHKT